MMPRKTHLNRALSNRLNPKSRSVENLSGQHKQLGLKPANSEVNMLLRSGAAPSRSATASSVRTAKSEFRVDKLGADEKVEVGAAVLASMPAELRPRGQAKADRQRVSKILKTSSVIELQRQLLTTVMENEVSDKCRKM